MSLTRVGRIETSPELVMLTRSFWRIRAALAPGVARLAVRGDRAARDAVHEAMD